MIGATAGRTTLAGEGLQHDDGHTHVLASTVPVIRAYDPAFAYELAAIVRDGIDAHVRRRRGRLLLRHRLQRELRRSRRSPRASDEGIVRGLYRFAAAPELADAEGPGPPRGLGLDPAAGAGGPGPPRRAVRRRRRGLLGHVVPAAPPRGARRWSAGTGSTRTGRRASRTSRQVLGADGGPIVVATDWIRTLPDLVAPLDPGAVPRRSARTASAAATRARRCGPTSRSTRPRSSPRPRSPASPGPAARIRRGRSGDPGAGPRPRGAATRSSL